MQVVINNCYGGFSLSDKAVRLYAEKKGLTLYPEPSEYGDGLEPTYYLVPEQDRIKILKEWNTASLEERKKYNEESDREALYCRDLERNDPVLIEVVRELGREANGPCADLGIVEIPDDVEWEMGDGRV